MVFFISTDPVKLEANEDGILLLIAFDLRFVIKGGILKSRLGAIGHFLKRSGVIAVFIHY